MFDRRYSSLVEKFMRLAESEGSVYLPTIRPAGPVDYVFIGMEPSLGHWARTPQQAEEKVRQGFTNFAFSIGDFILHYCIREYLCRSRGSTYYITDLSKGAMLTDEAKRDPEQRYEQWFEVLSDELALVEKRTTKTVAVGEAVKHFLESRGLSDIYVILHYSPQAAKYRQKWIQWDGKGFREFKGHVSNKDIIATARAVTRQAKMDWILTSPSLRKLETQDLTDSQKMLMFSYKCYFQSKILGSSRFGSEEKGHDKELPKGLRCMERG
jgi:hypothetical protein